MISKFYLYILCTICIMCCVLNSCSDAITEQDKEFITVYTEILKARETYPDTLSSNKAVKEILKAYKLSDTAFTKLYREYSQNPEKMRALLDSVRSHLESEMKVADTNSKRQ